MTTNSLTGGFKDVSSTQGATIVQLPEQILTIEIDGKQEPVFSERDSESPNGFTAYTLDANRQRNELSYNQIEKEIKAGKQTVPLPLVYDENNLDKFLADSELQRIALAYKNNTTLSGPLPSFMGSDITRDKVKDPVNPKNAFAKASTTMDMDNAEVKYTVKTQNPEIDVG